VLYEVVPGADMVELHTAIDHAKAFLARSAARRVSPANQRLSESQPAQSRRRDVSSGSALLAIADKSAQLPRCCAKSKATALRRVAHAGHVEKPSKLSSFAATKIKVTHLRAAYDLVSSLHFSGDQSGAQTRRSPVLQDLINADRWAIYLFSESKGFEGATLEAIAVRKPGQEASDEENGDAARTGSSDRFETKAAKRAAAGMGIIKRKERGQFVVAVPLNLWRANTRSYRRHS
jgi:hypothetical protein